MKNLVLCGWMMLLAQHVCAQDALAYRLSGSEALFRPKPGLWANKAYSASLVLDTNSAAGIYGEQRFMSDLHHIQSLFRFTAKNQAFQIGYSRIGIVDYSESRIGLSTGILVGKGIMIGINIGYASGKANGYEAYGEIDAGVGTILQIDEKVRFGIQLSRIPALLKKESKYGFMARVGLGYSLSDVCALSLEAVKEYGRPVIVDIGLWYSFHENFYTRMGFSAAISLASFSVGYKRKQFTVDICSAYHLSLGGTWGLAMVYHFKNEK